MNAPWPMGRMASFDIESSGLDLEQDRIVTASVILVGGGQDTEEHGWLSDAGGVEIQKEASDLHKVTTEKARAEGRLATQVVKEVSALLAEQVAAGIPLVIMNARFDLTMLDRELQRYQLPALAEQAGREPWVIDPYVIDKRADKWRKGKRTLKDLCAHYGVVLKDAHTSAADALATARLAYKLAVRYPQIDLGLEELHAQQTRWAREQAIDLQAHLRKKDPAAVVEPHWPLIPRQQNGGHQ
ncbi:DNA polymerase-3 subunit epsilon [Streptomyces sp. TLI_235]|nr:exonuclease domain-containing protein [Streptomyces sp. TLI_235]PBC80161.1 DNA polymerase-3 subunit epsilon [Streptomyces sp. TLI_235]